MAILTKSGELYTPLSRQRAIVTRQNNIFTQDAIARWMESGGFERHLKRMRRVYQERRDAIVETLEAGQRRGLALDWCPPDGGMALWLDSGADSELVATRAAERGVYVASEPEFWPGAITYNDPLVEGSMSASCSSTLKFDSTKL